MRKIGNERRKNNVVVKIINTNKHFYECQNCGIIHYGVTLEESQVIKNHLVDEFNERNLKSCSGCGSFTSFKEVPENYANRYLDGDEVQPILYNDERSINT